MPPMKWNAWGDPAAAKPLSDGIRALLEQALGVDGRPRRRTRRPTRCGCGRRRCRTPTATALAAIVGAEYCVADDHARLLRAGGKSTLDLLRRKDSGVQDAPDAVLLPGDEDEIAADPARTARSTASRSSRSAAAPASSAASTRSAATSRPWCRWTCAGSTNCTPSTRCPARPNSAPGVTGPEAERLLGERGFSLGHFPQSFQFATIGGFAATRSSGQDSAGYGRFDDMVRGLRAVTPAGVLDLGRAPASAAGPDLRQLIIGSEGVFGVITRVRVRVHPVPEATRYEAWSFPDFATGAARCAPSCRPAPGRP